MVARFYAAQIYQNMGDHTAAQDFASQFARFLVNDLVTFTGPGWTIIEAYDSATNDRQVPVTDTDMDSFTGTFSWKDNTVKPDDWIVLQTVMGADEFQVFFKLVDTTANSLSNRMEVQMIPFGNWTTNVGLPTASPTKPASVVPATPVLVDAPTQASNNPLRAAYSIVADEGMFAFLWDAVNNANTDCQFMYCGSLDGSRASDTRPYVIYDLPDAVRWDNAYADLGYFARISPLDANVAGDSGTLLTGGAEKVMNAQPTGAVHSLWNAGQPLGEGQAHPVGVFFPDTNNRHFAGYLRNVYSAHQYMGSVGTFGGLKYLFRTDAIGSVLDPSICLLWDESTVYPPVFP